MYTFTSYKNVNDIIYKGINGANQTMIMEFEKWYHELNNQDIYFIKFYVANKRKQGYKFREQTGRDGIKSLLWAKRCLIDFLSNKINTNKENIITVFWDDKKRRDVYIRGLKHLGFKLQKDSGREALVLKINKTV